MTTGEQSEELSFLDQCTVICFGYVSSRAKLEIQSDMASDARDLGALCDLAEQELAEFEEKGELRPYTDAASHLAKTYEDGEVISGRLQECLQKLNEYRSLEQEAFRETANEFIESPIDSWEKITQLLQLVFKACEQHGTANVGTVVDISVQYMRNALSDFVISQGGWKTLVSLKSEELDQMGVSTSIVVVEQESVPGETADNALKPVASESGSTSEEVKESPAPEDAPFPLPKIETASPVSPLNTPPLSIPSSINTDDDRDSLATPPEMVERPAMTESYIQAMGEEFRRASNTSGNGFELIDSDNGGTVDSQNEVKTVDNAETTESHDLEPEEMQHFRTTQTQSEDSAPEDEKATQEPSTPTGDAQDPMFGGYLPHISIGVAAAAIAGFFVLKNL